MATEFYKGRIPLVRRSLNEGFIRGTPDEAPAFGCVPRDYDADPVEMRDSPDSLKLIDPSDYDAYYDEQEEAQDSLEHKYLPGGVDGPPAFEPLDQGRFLDCWAHSTAHALMFARLRDNLPVLRFNAVAVATMLGRTNGGWCGLSAKFAGSDGYPVMGDGPGEWPQWTRDRKYDTPELRASMATHKATELWYDLGRREYDQTMTERQLNTLGLTNVPCPTDYNRFSHSMLQIRIVRIEKGHWGRLTLNQWKGFGLHNLCVLADMTPDNAVGLRSTTPSGK